MNVALFSDPLPRLAANLLAIGVFEDALADSWAFKSVDAALDGALSKAAGQEEFAGGAEKTLSITCGSGIEAERVLVVGLGPAKKFAPSDVRFLSAAAARSARSCGAETVAVAGPKVDKFHRDRVFEGIGCGFELGAYKYDAHMGTKKAFPVTELRIALPPRDPAGKDGSAARKALGRGATVGRSVNRARDLVNGPPNQVTPTFLADTAKALSKEIEGLDLKVLSRRQCENKKMGLYLAVAQGSEEDPKFIHLTYNPPGRSRPKRTIGLVGKGVTFDSGGLSLKSAKHMEDMKTDMAGGAVVISAMEAIARLKPNVRVHAVCAATENMPSGTAYRPGDVFAAANGRTVEVLNTDAEGRLTLADAIHYVVGQEVDEIIELSTLTGACVVGLGNYTAGLMSQDDDLAARVLAAAGDAGEDFWRLPLVPRIADDLKSEIADCKNIGASYGGAISAGHFLVPFAGDTPFVHCDIAGPSSAEKPWGVHPRGGTGVAVMTLVEYVTRTALA